MEILFELLGYLLLDVLGEVLLELGIGAFQNTFHRENRSPAVATVGYLIVGAAIGGLSLWVHPARFLQRGTTPGFSLVVAPLVGGAAMHAWGHFRRRGGHPTTNLATFHGGAALLFGCALVRLLWAR
jgi:hypothetical protein